MSIPRSKDPRIPSYVEKLKKIRDKINDYKAGINRTEIHEMEDGKPFKLPMFRVDSEFMAHKVAGGPPRDQLGYYNTMLWLQENIRRVHFREGWSEYNRIYLDFSSGSLVVRFKEKGKRSFDSYKQEFNFSNVTTEDELIRMENDDIVLLIGWTNDIPYILVEDKINYGESIYILYRVNGVSDADAIIDPEKPTRRADDPDDDDDDGDFVPIKKERERTIRMREDTKPDKVNENELIDLTVTHRVPGIVDLTGDMDEVEPTRPISPVRPVRPNNPIRPVRPVRPISPIRSNEPVANNTMYEGESDYASEESEWNGIDFYGRDDETRYSRSPVKSPVISRRTSPFSNRSPFNRLNDADLTYMSPVREPHRQYVASPGKMQDDGSESNFEISLLDTEESESPIGHDNQLSSQSTALVSQLNHQIGQTEQSTNQPEQPEPSNQINPNNQPEQTNWMEQEMSENYESDDFNTMF